MLITMLKKPKIASDGIPERGENWYHGKGTMNYQRVNSFIFSDKIKDWMVSPIYEKSKVAADAKYLF